MSGMPPPVPVPPNAPADTTAVDINRPGNPMMLAELGDFARDPGAFLAGMVEDLLRTAREKPMLARLIIGDLLEMTVIAKRQDVRELADRLLGDLAGTQGERLVISLSGSIMAPTHESYGTGKMEFAAVDRIIVHKPNEAREFNHQADIVYVNVGALRITVLDTGKLDGAWLMRVPQDSKGASDSRSSAPAPFDTSDMAQHLFVSRLLAKIKDFLPPVKEAGNGAAAMLPGETAPTALPAGTTSAPRS